MFVIIVYCSSFASRTDGWKISYRRMKFFFIFHHFFYFCIINKPSKFYNKMKYIILIVMFVASTDESNILRVNSL